MFAPQPAFLDSKIVVIDDEQIAIDIITAHLNVAGFWNVVGISNPIDAASRLKRENPELVLVDLSMPDVSGNFLIHLVRQDPVLEAVPVIVVTADGSAASHQRALDLGADEIMTKPLERSRLVERVEGALQRKLRHDQTQRTQRQARTRPAEEKYSVLRDAGGRLPR